MEKLLLGSKDRTPYDDELKASEGRLNIALRALRKFISEPGMAELRDMMTGGNKIKEQFADDVSETLAGIKIPSLRAEHAEKLKQMQAELDGIITKAQNYKGSLINFIPDSMIELCEGNVQFSSGAGKLIDNACKIYIENDDQMQVYTLSRTLADVLNKLQPYLLLYRYVDTIRRPFQDGTSGMLTSVKKGVDGRWEADDGLVIDMPGRLNRIGKREEFERNRLTDR